MADTKCMGQIHLPKGFASVKAWTTEDHIVFRTTAQNSRSIKKNHQHAIFHDKHKTC